MPSKKTPPATFQNQLAEIEARIESIESNETTLEDSLSDFEQGVKLIREAQKALLQAEQKVQKLTEANLNEDNSSDVDENEVDD